MAARCDSGRPLVEDKSRPLSASSPCLDPTSGLIGHYLQITLVSSGIVIPQRGNSSVTHICRLRSNRNEPGLFAACARSKQRTEKHHRRADIHRLTWGSEPSLVTEAGRTGQRRERRERRDRRDRRERKRPAVERCLACEADSGRQPWSARLYLTKIVQDWRRLVLMSSSSSSSSSSEYSSEFPTGSAPSRRRGKAALHKHSAC